MPVYSKRRATKRGKILFNARHKQSIGKEEESETDEEINNVTNFPSMIHVLLTSQQALFFGLLAFRIVNAMLIQTSYVPDEYWQSVEVSHKMAFGYGYLTWEWREGIRSHVYPLLFALLYKLFALLHLDSRVILIKSPRLMQALFAAVGDLFLYKLSARLAGHKAARWTLLCQLTSWFTFYTYTRTLTNSIEAILTTVALYYFPWPNKAKKAHWKMIVCVFLALVVRPTAAITWLPLGIWYLWLYRHCMWSILKLAIFIGLPIVYIIGLVDRLCYGEWVWVQYNFLKFNIFHNIGSFYGSHPCHWYISQGLIVVLGTHCFPFIIGIRKGLQKPILALIFWTILVLSCLEHKEFRFILPVLPLIMHICGCVLSGTFNDSSDDDSYDDDVAVTKESISENDKSEANGLEKKDDTSQNSIKLINSHKQWKWILIAGLILTNLPVALYTSLIHQRGVIDVTLYLHDEAATSSNMSVVFLMPCHSTPYYSYIHRNINMRFLTCEPNLNSQPNYTDEADIFFLDPNKWLTEEFDDKNQIISITHVVMFNSLIDKVSNWLHLKGFQECARFFHTHFPEGKVGSHVVALCHNQWWHNKHYHGQKKSVVTLSQKHLRSEAF